MLGVPVKPTIKEVDGERRVVKTLQRAKLWEVQTPQVHAADLMAARSLSQCWLQDSPPLPGWGGQQGLRQSLTVLPCLRLAWLPCMPPRRSSGLRCCGQGLSW